MGLGWMYVHERRGEERRGEERMGWAGRKGWKNWTNKLRIYKSHAECIMHKTTIIYKTFPL
jgi:hypothetical protein